MGNYIADNEEIEALNFIKLVMVDPQLANSDHEMKTRLIESVRQLLKSKEQFGIRMDVIKCSICNIVLNFEDKNTYFVHQCKNAYCKACFQILCKEEAKEIVDERIYQTKCESCKKVFAKNVVDSMYEKQERENFIQTLLLKNKIDKCSICMEFYKINKKIILKCQHKLCYNCLKKYIENLINEGKVNSEALCCPECKIPLDPSLIQHIVTPQCWDKITFFSLNNLLSKPFNKIKGKMIKCPKCELISEANNNMFIISCPNCKTEFCIFCLKMHDTNSTCAEYKAWEEENSQGDKLFNKIIKEKENEHKYKQCPSCKEMIEKSEGCNHMKCKCNAEFCFLCGILYLGKKPQCSCPLFRYDNI